METPGICGRILRVDLTTGRVTRERPDAGFYRNCFGGRSLIAYYLLREVPPGADPLGPENRLIFANGPLTGAPVSGSGRNSVGAKSPLTGGFGDAEVGGYWGAELKRAGYDALIVEGRSGTPVYLHVTGEAVEIRDATTLRGLSTGEVEAAIRAECGDRSIRVCQIGPAGENLVRFACVVNDLHHFAGRCGLGAVMGSKNLRAIAVRGGGGVEVADPDVFRETMRWLRENFEERCSGLREEGTAGVLYPLHLAGGLPTRNFIDGQFEGAGSIGADAMNEAVLVGDETCFACMVRCKRVVESDAPWRVDRKYGGPEYESLSALGSNCGIDDIRFLARANEFCAASGLDTISTGNTLAFAMECFERGILGPDDFGGLDLSFGRPEEALELMEMIVERRGIGDLLAEGPHRAAQEIGPEAMECVMHVKGQGIPMHEPRYKMGLGLGYAVSPTGADHCHNLHDSIYAKEGPALRQMRAFGIRGPLPVDDLGPEKVRLFRYETDWRHMCNCLVLCLFLPYDHARVRDLVRAATGWDVTIEGLMEVGERAIHLTRAFNVLSGLTIEDDRLPKRFFEPFRSGPLKGVAIREEELRDALRTYYAMIGWDEEGVPRPETLDALDISWVSIILEKRGR
jgi:aldehyde:ferredoxin oxidoreductase